MHKGVAILAGTSLVATFFAFHFWNQLREDRKRIAGLQQQVEQLQAAGAADPWQAASAEALQPAVPGSAPVPPLPATPSVAPTIPGPAIAAGLTLASNCEEMLALVKRSSSVVTAELSAELKLAPAEAQRFAEMREAQAIAASSCSSGGGSTANPEQLHAQLMATLGPARFEQMQEFNTARKTRQNIAALGSQLNENGVPLTDEQGRQLMATILEEYRQSRRETTLPVAPADPRGRLAYEEENLRLTEERAERVLKVAQTYLRPEQLAQLRGTAKRQTNSMRSSLEQMRASVEAGRPISSSQPVMIIRDAAPAR